MFKDIKLKTRLIAQAVFTTVLMIITAVFGIKGIEIANTGARDVYEGGIDSIEYLLKLENIFKTDIQTTVQKMREETLSRTEGSYNIIQALNKIPIYLEDYSKTALHHEQRVAFESLKASIKKSTPTIEKLLEIIDKENKDNFTSYVRNNLFSATLPLIEEINRLIDSHIISSKNDYQIAVENSHFFENLMLTMIIIAILAMALSSFFIIRSITIPLAKTIDTLNTLSRGDLSINFDFVMRNEIGEMMSALKKMVQSIKKMISETQEEIVVIANSVEEVTSSISEASTGTTETAAAVTETTTTVEELQQTAQVSSNKADDVLKSSEETLKVVMKSEQSLKNTIDDMTHIQEKMNVISESILKLSEHSLVIGDIITTVNELAEQSNLLAVNAAIEAAKAGEQGKGFGVVAQEIRTLAEQSKVATSQVRSILNDIQNATSTAVMATEQGSKAVNKGVKQSNETNHAMQSLITNITQVSQAAKQISISSQQQLIGVDQARTAMANINIASEQHVEQMKQIETAVLSLNEVSKNLKALISQYKTSDINEIDGKYRKETKGFQTKVLQESLIN